MKEAINERKYELPLVSKDKIRTCTKAKISSVLSRSRSLMMEITMVSLEMAQRMCPKWLGNISITLGVKMPRTLWRLAECVFFKLSVLRRLVYVLDVDCCFCEVWVLGLSTGWYWLGTW